MVVFIQLNGPNDDGKKPKAPAQNGWQSPGHKGINPRTYQGWYGLRCDGLIVIDCDSSEAANAWNEIAHANGPDAPTWVRKTPRGFHFIYRWHDPLGELDHIKGPHAGVLPGIDIRQGPSSQIVYAAPGLDPGYSTLHGNPTNLVDFHPPWAASFVIRKADTYADDVWDEMPDGVGNNTLTAIAGTMRKQGMGPATLVRCLSAINKITMTLDPMPRDQIIAIARSVSRYGVDPHIEEIEYTE